jgi:hypothetical protein
MARAPRAPQKRASRAHAQRGSRGMRASLQLLLVQIHRALHLGRLFDLLLAGDLRARVDIIPPFLLVAGKRRVVVELALAVRGLAQDLGLLRASAEPRRGGPGLGSRAGAPGGSDR